MRQVTRILKLNAPSVTAQYLGREKVQYKKASERAPLEDL